MPWLSAAAAAAWRVGHSPLLRCTLHFRTGVCHERSRSIRLRVTVREMKEGPSGSAIRSLIPSHHEAPTHAIAYTSRSSATGSIDNFPGRFSSTDDSRLRGALPGPDSYSAAKLKRLYAASLRSR